MKIKIDKITSLNNIAAFIQINLIKGFKYIDKAREIVSLYHYNNSSPNL